MSRFQSLEFLSIRHGKGLAHVAVALTGDEPSQRLMAHGSHSLPNVLLYLMDGLCLSRRVIDILRQFRHQFDQTGYALYSSCTVQDS